jgi:hypothetical protein
LRAGEFRRRLADEFDFMVAPLVFDLELRVHPASLAPAGAADGGGSDAPGGATAGGWKILRVYGSPDAEERRLSGGGSIMRVSHPAARSQCGAPLARLPGGHCIADKGLRCTPPKQRPLVPLRCFCR